MKKNRTILLAAALVIIGCGVYLLSRNNAASPNSSEIKIASATIVYSEIGFSPAELTVKAGDVIAVTNRSTNILQMQSDPHPGHTDNADLNIGTITAGQTINFTATKTGTFGFHNHFRPSNKASITVQ